MKFLYWSWLVVLLLAAFGVRAQAPDSGAPATAAVSVTVRTLAGVARQSGAANGSGMAARFKRPRGIAVAPDGTLYVTDTENHTIRRITPAGVVTTFAGAAGRQGSADGTGEAARFSSPVGIALDTQGNVYVTDGENQTIRKITPAGSVTTLAGKAGSKGAADGTGEAARFNYPHGIAVAGNGTVYVADTKNHSIRQISTSGAVTTWAGAAGQKGAGDGPNAAARFYNPAGLAIDEAGTLYVADNGNHTIRAIEPAGGVRTLAGLAGKNGRTDGAGAVARFDTPNGIAVDARGNLYVADYINSTVRHITPAGEVTTLAGSARSWGSRDGTGPDARFEFPFGVAVGATGNLIYIADTSNHTIRAIDKKP
jgi:sugar lactone lactonase YvrE